MTHTISQHLVRYWGLLALLGWGGLVLALGLISTAPYGLDEGAARGLLLIWSIFDNIANPIVMLGVPDFRALLFIPLGAYWPGSLLAAKVFTLVLAFAAIALLYRWSKRSADEESALIASALLLISPYLLNEIDAIGTGVYLLLAFALGAWLNDAYQRAQRAFGGWFFVQLLWVGVTVTLHPIGLAYPLALALTWHQHPIDPRLKRQLLAGLALVTTVLLILRGGWKTIEWGHNPLLTLAQAHYPTAGLAEPSWIIGGLIAALLACLCWLDRRFLTSDPVGLMLLVGTALGLAAANEAWVLIACALLLYRGTPYLVKLNQSIPGDGLLRQRGLVLALIFVVGTSFMVGDKGRALAVAGQLLNPQDKLIQKLADEAADMEADFRAASQWPGRTMLAVKRDVFPLPHGAPDGESLLANIKGITHLMFDPRDPRNHQLGNNMGDLTGVTETLTLEEGGVIIRVRTQMLLHRSQDSVTEPESATEELGATANEATPP